MHSDDLKNPEFRKGRRSPAKKRQGEPAHRPALNEGDRRARFAEQTARAEFGRFYWNAELHRRMERELKNSRRQKREEEQARRRRRNGAR